MERWCARSTGRRGDRHVHLHRNVGGWIGSFTGWNRASPWTRRSHQLDLYSTRRGPTPVFGGQPDIRRIRYGRIGKRRTPALGYAVVVDAFDVTLARADHWTASKNGRSDALTSGWTGGHDEAWSGGTAVVSRHPQCGAHERTSRSWHLGEWIGLRGLRAVSLASIWMAFQAVDTIRRGGRSSTRPRACAAVTR